LGQSETFVGFATLNFFMMRLPLFRRLALGTALLGLTVTAALARTDQKFTSSSTLTIEAQTLVKLLEQAHYNRDAVRPADYAEVVPSFMSDLDSQRLFFLASDKAAFSNRYNRSDSLYWNISSLGNIDAAYDIFATYETRTAARINWIFTELQKDFDLTGNDSYRFDRTKAEWPATAAAADELWHQRLKFELIAELMNKKTLDEAKQVVRKRYERSLKRLGEVESTEIAELFLSNVARLYDPHSTYFSADTYEDFGIQMKLELVGIGAVLSVEDDYCTVKEIVPGGPADLSKQLKPGDKILSVTQNHDEPVEIIGMKLRKIVERIRGHRSRHPEDLHHHP
jgi:carboxyl-terminal processing protease